MTIVRVNSAGWSIGDSLTSAQANAIDINTTNALDKRSGQTDTLASVVTLSGAGRVVPTRVTGANANTTYLVSGGNLVIQVNNTVGGVTYTLSNTNAQDGDLITVYCDPTYVSNLTIQNAAATTLFILGNTSFADGTCAVFQWSAVTSAWVLMGSNQMSRIQTQTFLSSGTWTAPPGVTQVYLVGCGGGGGGFSGSQVGASASNTSNCGGPGGGGALLGSVLVTVVPGTGYTVTIGAGGTGGAAATDGASTTFGALATFAGAAAGIGALPNANANNGGVTVAQGGSATSQMTAYPASYVIYSTASPLNNNIVAAPSQGGAGATYTLSSGRNGGTSPQGFAGGGQGTNGTAAVGGYYSGGPGGGGGGGPFGAGGNGGNPGNGVSGGVGGNGVAGASAAANSGAGGGGGGGAGQGSTGEGTSGAGGNGGSGRLIVAWVK